MMNIFKLTFVATGILLAMFLASCSNFYHRNDAVIIKIDSAYKYSQNPYTKEYRNGSALRGTVLKVLKSTEPDSCPVNPHTKFITKTYVVFVDSLSGDDEDKTEFIPIEDVVLVGQLAGLPENKWNNINLFENYNNPSRVKDIRAVPVDSVFDDNCDNVCGCRPFNMNLPDMNFSCPPRFYPWFFAELRAGYASYNDEKNSESIGRSSFFGELAFGARFGNKKQWGLGLAVNYGIKSYNSYTGEDIARSAAMFHGRWQSTSDKFLGFCMKPFFYGQLGLSIDDLSMDLTKFFFNRECQDRLSAYLPLINLTLPVSAGIGVGLDIPVSPVTDISVDIGFRSVSFGETILVGGFLAPTGRNVNMFVARAGITF